MLFSYLVNKHPMLFQLKWASDNTGEKKNLFPCPSYVIFPLVIQISQLKLDISITINCKGKSERLKIEVNKTFNEFLKISMSKIK